MSLTEKEKKEWIEKAEALGIKVTFNSKKVGIYVNGEKISVKDLFPDLELDDEN